MSDINDEIPETETSAFQTYLRLLGYLKPLWIPFVVSIAGFAIFAASNPLLAKLMEMTIAAIEHKNASARWTLPLLAIAIFIFRGAGTFLGTYFNSQVSQRVVSNIRIDLFNHLTALPVDYFNSRSDGHILQRITGGVGLVSNAITDAVKIIIREGLTVLFLLAYVFYLNWRLSLVFLAIAPFIILVAAYTTKSFRSITNKNEEAQGALLQTASELISGHEVMRVFAGHDYEQKRYQAAVKKTYNRQMKITKISALSAPVMQLLVAIALATIIFLLLQPETLALHTTGELIGYLTAVAMIPKSMQQLSGVNLTIQRGIIGAGRIFRILDSTPEDDKGTIERTRIEGRITASHVYFRYKKNRGYVLDDISFDINPGTMVALVGRSGGGKSTLAALLQRFYDVDKGSINIDGIDIRDYRLANLRNHIGLVSQNLVLFNDSIRNNIAYGSMNTCSDADIIEAARKAHALEFIEQQRDGLDTVIGDNGLQLSGGQRQRIAIARAFLKNAPILILDEATSALDNESEQKIQQALDTMMKGRTTLVIAHRLSTIEKADNILVMDKGHIVEQGSHRELLARGGVYKNLYTSAVHTEAGDFIP
jgi:subfamily B ATP-binding cassette protein MsbA